MKLFPNFTSIPFDYLYISWARSYVSNLGFLVDMFMLDGIDRELHSLERLELKFGLSSQFFNKIPSRILLDVFFHLFRSVFLFPGIFIHDILKLRCHLDTETYQRLPWQICNFTCEITNYCWNFVPKLRSNSSPMILINIFAVVRSCLAYKIQFI